MSQIIKTFVNILPLDIYNFSVRCYNDHNYIISHSVGILVKGVETVSPSENKSLKSSAARKLGASLRALRKQSGYTIDELADRVHISAKTLARIEKAESKITVDKLFALAEVLGVAPDELIRRATSPYVSDLGEWPEEAVKDLEFAREFIKAKYSIQ